MSKQHKVCKRTAKKMRRADKKENEAAKDLIYWMRVMDQQPQDYNTAAEWLTAIAQGGDEFVEANFQQLKKRSIAFSAAYDAWRTAVLACAKKD